VKRIVALCILAMGTGAGAWWLHRACIASMQEFERGYIVAAGDGGAK
jgi:hypothetical protein